MDDAGLTFFMKEEFSFQRIFPEKMCCGIPVYLKFNLNNNTFCTKKCKKKKTLGI